MLRAAYRDAPRLLCPDCYLVKTSSRIGRKLLRLAKPRATVSSLGLDTEGPVNGIASLAVEDSPSITYLHRLQVVNRAADYIAENLGESITLDDVARAAGMSKFHLHRVFSENVGTTLGRYLSAARLKAALLLLSAPETARMSALDVALLVGFEDASAFTRSFQRRYGLTPSTLRQGHRPREFPLLSLDSARLQPGVTVVSLPEFWTYGYEVRGMKNRSFLNEAPAGFSLSWDTIQRHGVEGIGGDLALPNYSWVLPDEAGRLLCGFRSSERMDLRGVTRRWVPAGNWLRARHTGPIPTRWQTWTRLQLQQLLVGRPEDGRAPFEEEAARDPVRPERAACDVYFPC